MAALGALDSVPPWTCGAVFPDACRRFLRKPPCAGLFGLGAYAREECGGLSATVAKCPAAALLWHVLERRHRWANRAPGDATGHPEPLCLSAFLVMLRTCEESGRSQDSRSAGGLEPIADGLFRSLGRSVPEMSFAYWLFSGSDSDEVPLPRELHLQQPTTRPGWVLLAMNQAPEDLRFYDKLGLVPHVLPELFVDGTPCRLQGDFLKRNYELARLRPPSSECLGSWLSYQSALPALLGLQLVIAEKAGGLGNLLEVLLQAGYRHFKLSRLSLFNDWADTDWTSLGPFGDAATDWRLGLAWRNSSSLLGDLQAVDLLQRRGVERFELHAAKPKTQRGLGICLTGQLRGICSFEHGPRQLHGLLLSRFEGLGGFDAFAVVPSEDCEEAKRILGSEPLQAEVVCVDSLFMSPEELHWIQEGPKADPDICPGHHCVYVWRDVDTCGRLMRRHMDRYRISYWRVARARLDLLVARFPWDVAAAFSDDDTIWGYAIPDRQWIGMPDRFAIGPQQLMLDVYFGTYRWMLNAASWKSYDPTILSACMRRGHLEVLEVKADGAFSTSALRRKGKLWPCPEHSARGLAYPGPENVLETRLLTFQGRGITVRLRQDICFNHLAADCGRIQDSNCEQKPIRHWRGHWQNDWAASRFKGDLFEINLRRAAAMRGSEKMETGLLHHDGIFAASLAEFLIAEWGGSGAGHREPQPLQRPPKTVDLGAGRGALVEQLGRWGLPVVGVDGSCLVELTLGSWGLCADLAHSLGVMPVAACDGPGSGMDPELYKKVFGGTDKAEDHEKAWCRWLRGLESSDWALVFDIAQDLPRAMLPRLAKQIRRYGGRGVVLSWAPWRGQASNVEELLRLLQGMGYVRDWLASRRLQHFGGLLCCPEHRHTLVLRRPTMKLGQAELCQVTVLAELPGSRPCILRENFGCVPGGIWVHFGCSAHFLPHAGATVGATKCVSPYYEYSECAWLADATPMLRNSRKRHSQTRAPRFAARALFRSDLAGLPQVPQANASQSHFFTHLFGISISYLYDYMDPLSSVAGSAWPAAASGRALTAAVLRALKMAVMSSLAVSSQDSYGIGGLRRELDDWPSFWHGVRLLLLGVERQNQKDLSRVAMLLSALRVAAQQLPAVGVAPLNTHVGDGCAAAASVLPSLRAPAGPMPKEFLPHALRLEDSRCLDFLQRYDELMQQVLPVGTRKVWFEQSSTGVWHARFRSDSAWARYLYRFAYQASAGRSLRRFITETQ
eukprot:TRINITY_DN16303_c0_g3_i1.p1 TRINITY_DN16303_c0_g3~~TRINITY_DN16303_c0_g3_i1.p1  ORF type:complete len:1239 (-),score=176.68 TRINITY_DN16303_c0_g3_i1:71-3787(-)